MEIGESFRQRIEEQIGMAVTKYFDGGYSGQVTVQKSSSRFAADCKLHLDSGVILHAAGEAMDPQVAFDAAQQRIEKRLRRYKRKLKDHHTAGHGDGAFAEVAYTVMDGMPDEDHEIAEDFAPAIIAESSKQLKTMSVASAVMALDMTDEPMLMFRSAAKELNIVYRRHDGNIGWIDAASIKG
jgi:putative sigma-54 modulation protein